MNPYRSCLNPKKCPQERPFQKFQQAEPKFLPVCAQGHSWSLGPRVCSVTKNRWYSTNKWLLRLSMNLTSFKDSIIKNNMCYYITRRIHVSVSNIGQTMSNTEYPLSLGALENFQYQRVVSYWKNNTVFMMLEKHEYDPSLSPNFTKTERIKYTWLLCLLNHLVVLISSFSQKLVCQWPCARDHQRVIHVLLIEYLVFKLSYSLGPEEYSVHFHVFVIHVVLGLREEIVS